MSYLSVTNLILSAFYTGSSSVPWKQIEQEPHKFFTNGSLSDDKSLAIKEPSHMHNICANGLYHRWYTRQQNKERPLRIAHELRTVLEQDRDQIRKPKKRYVEVEDAADEGVEAGDEGVEAGDEGVEVGDNKKDVNDEEDASDMVTEEVRDQGSRGDKTKKKLQEMEEHAGGSNVAAPPQSPAGTPYTHQHFLKTLSQLPAYQKALGLIKYTVSPVFNSQEMVFL